MSIPWSSRCFRLAVRHARAFRCSLVLIGALGTFLLVAQTAAAETITFEQVPVGTFSTYMEAGFTVSTNSGPWVGFRDYGNPAPHIQFVSLDLMTGTVQITNGGSPFTFGSVDLYSSVTTIPYSITGFLNATQVFSLEGTVPNTFGNFATVTNPNSNAVIDSLIITLTNPGFGGGNPMGLDNVVVTAAAVVPEPGTFALFITGLLPLAGAVLGKHRRSS
jgi:hypothetical protein